MRQGGTAALAFIIAVASARDAAAQASPSSGAPETSAAPVQAPGAADDEREVQRVVLVAPPEGLESAVRIALDPWGIDIAVIDRGAPGSTMPASADRARGVARANHAGAVVWIGKDESGHALWMFDSQSGRVTARRLSSGPPFDAPTAAAVALSVKTLLRHSAVAPVVERYGAEDALKITPPRPPPRPPPPRRVRVLIGTGLGVRLRPGSSAGAEPRIRLGVRVEPVAWLGIGAAIEAGPGVAIDQPGFVGHYTDLQVRAGATGTVGLTAGLGLEGGLGLSLHRTEIDGSVAESGQHARRTRWNPTVDVSADAAWSVGGITLTLGGEGAVATQRQDYRVRGQSVLAVPEIEIEIDAGARFPLR